MTLDMDRVFKPTEKQTLFWGACKHYDEVGYGGARGGAETTAVCWLASDHFSLEYPGNIGLIVRKDLVDLRKTTMLEFRKYMKQYHPGLPVKWHNSSPIHCDIYTGHHDSDNEPIFSRIYWSDTKDIEDWRSGNLGYVIMDEATEISDEFVKMIRAAIGRHRLPDGRRAPRRLIWASNPGPGWCKKEFPVNKVGPQRREIRLALEDGSHETVTRAFIPAKPKDNPHLPKTFEAHLRENYPEIWYRRWVEGDWAAFEGMVFPEFDLARHVLPEHVALRGYGYRHFLAMDWGRRNPAAAMLVSKDSDNHWYVWGEHYKAGWDPEQHVPALRKMMHGLGPHIQLMDPAAVDQSTGIQIYHQFNKMPYDDPDERFRFAGWPKCKNGPNDTISYLSYLMRNDMLHISPKCPWFIEQISEWEWEPMSPIMADRRSPKEIPKDKDDHTIDAVMGPMQYWRMAVVRAREGEKVSVLEQTFVDAEAGPKIKREDVVDTLSPVRTRSTNDRINRKSSRRDPYEGL